MEGLQVLLSLIHRVTLKKRNQKMFQCDTETYLKNHTISVKIIILEYYKVVFSYDFEDIAIFGRGEH